MKHSGGNSGQLELEIVQLERETDQLLECIKPTSFSNAVRSKAADFVRNVILAKLPNVVVAECGSTCFRAYLADSDLDLTVLAADNSDMHYLISIFTALCEEIYRSDGASAGPHSQFTIRNVDFINARTKLISCLINNIGVDVTLNQASALDCLVFLEKADRLIGNHLFKQSVLLIKCWCLNESYRHCGMKILGAKDGMLSSYALSVLVLYLFNKYSGLQHPFHVLHMFFFYYCNFPWDTHVQTLSGPTAINAMSTPKSAYFDQQKFSPVHNRFSSLIQPATRRDGRFISKVCNIQDPVDEVNNLGVSVNSHTMAIIHNAFVSGYNMLTTIIQRKAMLNYGKVHPTMANVPKPRSMSLSSTPSLPANMVGPSHSLDGTPICAALPDMAGPVSGPSSTAGNTPRRAPSNSAAASPNVAMMPTDSAPFVPALSLPSPLVLEGMMDGKHGGGGGGGVALGDPHSTAGPAIDRTMGSGPAYGFVNQALPGLLADFFPVSLEKYSCGPSSSPNMAFARIDLWEHPLQRVRGVESLVYCSLLSSGAVEDGTVDVLESDLKKLQSILENVRSQRSKPRSASEGSRAAMVSGTAAVRIPSPTAAATESSLSSPGDARPDQDRSEHDAKRLVCEVAVQTEALSPGPVDSCLVAPSSGARSGEEDMENDGEGEEEEDRVSLSSQATTATSSSADLLATVSDASLLNQSGKQRQAQGKSRSDSNGVHASGKSKDSSSSTAGDLGETSGSGESTGSISFVPREKDGIKKGNKKASLSKAKMAKKTVADLSVRDLSAPEIVREEPSVASSSGLLSLTLAAVAASSAGSSASGRTRSVSHSRDGLPHDLPDSPWARLIPGKVLGPVLLLSSVVVCYLLRLQLSEAVADMALFSSRRGMSLSSLANLSLAMPSSSSSSSSSSATAETSRAVEAPIVTHWVLLGDSITFGDFSSEPVLSDGLVGPLRQGLVQASTPSPLTGGGSLSSSAGTEGSSSGEGGAGVSKDGLGAADTLPYLWRKDNVTVAMTSTPHYTLSRSELADAGHYSCYRVAGLRLLADGSVAEGTKVVDTIIRISKKPRVLNRPSYQEVKLKRPLIIKLDFEAIPAPTFRWFRNGYHLPAQTTSELYIGETSPADSGTYSCEVRNIAGGYLWLEATVVVTE